MAVVKLSHMGCGGIVKASATSFHLPIHAHVRLILVSFLYAHPST